MSLTSCVASIARARRVTAIALAGLVLLGFSTARADEPLLIGTRPFVDHRNPPPYRKLSDAEFARYDLGMTVFNTQFVIAGTPGAGRRDGLGPLFNSASCDACHNNGAHGRGPTEDGPAPAPLVVQLAVPSPGGDQLADPPGDPVYGRVFNTISLPGVAPEGVVVIRYEDTAGKYPDGAAWKLRVPHYSFTNLRYGPISAQTVVKPRLAPASFGAGLLDAAGAESTPESATRRSHSSGSSALPNRGRFGWQASAVSVRDQTARAFSREMGLTSAGIAHDDCTPAETDCLHEPNGGSPEVSDELFDAVLSFQRWLAVPSSPSPHPQPDPDAQVFTDLGCASCHQPQLRLTLTDVDAKTSKAVIAPYTDLRLHDLGMRLADEDVGGHKVASKWRTAPLWGLGYRVSFERSSTFLHDGRARSAEEAILWHDGEAAVARERFEKLPATQRKAFLHWLETL